MPSTCGWNLFTHSWRRAMSAIPAPVVLYVTTSTADASGTAFEIGTALTCGRLSHAARTFSLKSTGVLVVKYTVACCCPRALLNCAHPVTPAQPAAMARPIAMRGPKPRPFPWARGVVPPGEDGSGTRVSICGRRSEYLTGETRTGPTATPTRRPARLRPSAQPGPAPDTASMPPRHLLIVNARNVTRPVFVIGAPHSGAESVGRALKISPGFHVTIGQQVVLQAVYGFARRPSLYSGRGDAAAAVIRDAFAQGWQIGPASCQQCTPQCRAAAGLRDGEAGPCAELR